MSSRPIPIPRSSNSSRAPTSSNRASIESVISMPFASGTNPGGRPTSRSFTIPAAAMPLRNSPRSRNSMSSRERLAAAVPFEPRIVRDCPPTATPQPQEHAGSGASSTSLPPPSPHRTVSATVPRRPSITTVSGSGPTPRRASTSQRHTSVSAVASPSPPVWSHTAPSPSPAIHATGPVPFPRPSYLDHSAMRNLLVTDISEGPSTTSRARSSSASRASVVSSDSEDDEYMSVPPPNTRATSSPPELSNPPSAIRLPTRWSEQMRNASLTVSADGRELTYNGSSSEREAAAARANFPIPPACGVYYFEVTISRARGGSSSGSKARISVGFAAANVSLNRLPGWDSRSWGYHGDDGCSYASQDTGTPYGRPFGANDVIGCGIDFAFNRAFFTKNGQLIGTAFHPLPLVDSNGSTLEVYPAVGLKNNNDAIRVNFGQERFSYDIEWYVLQARERVWTDVLETPVRFGKPLENEEKKEGKDKEPVEDETKTILNKLVLEYLDHHGYVRSAQALHGKLVEAEGGVSAKEKGKGKEVDGMDVDSEMDGMAVARAPGATPSSSTRERSFGLSPATDIARRTEVVNAVARGEIDYALDGLKKWFPGVVDEPSSSSTNGDGEETTAYNILLLKLRCRKFVELILETVEIRRRMLAAEAEMDVDFDEADVHEDATNGFSVSNGKASPSAASGKLHAQYDSILQRALAYGQALRNDYKTEDEEVRGICTRTFGILAYKDPLEAGGVEAEVAGDGARKDLAEEVRRAILISQGRPINAMLEKVYRHTVVCLLQLGMLGNGPASFIDVEREILSAL